MGSPFWISEHTYFVDVVHQIRSTQQRRMIELYELIARSFEESQLCIADMVHLHMNTTHALQSLQNQLLLLLEDHLPETILPEPDQLLLRSLSIFTFNLPHHKTGEFATLMRKAEYVNHRLQCIEDVLCQLSSAYWTINAEERSAFLNNALKISKLPVFSFVQRTILPESLSAVQYHTTDNSSSSDTDSSVNGCSNSSTLSSSSSECD